MIRRTLASLTESQIVELVDALASEVERVGDLDSNDCRSRLNSRRRSFDPIQARVEDFLEIGALVVASMKAVAGIELYRTQIHAGWLIAAGRIAEMKTGEGKTFACLLPACLMALDSMGVHIACPNDYLAKRDHDLLAPVYRWMGLSTASLTADASESAKKLAYRCDVLYGAAHTFGFDYLRDQLSLHRWQQMSLTDRLLGSVTGTDTGHHRIQRPLNAVIVDEADHVLLDDAMSPMVLSASGHKEARDADVHRRAKAMAQTLTMGRDFLVDPRRRQVHLTRIGFDQIYDHRHADRTATMRRPWHDYVIAAINAAMLFQVEQHYVVRGGGVQIVDHATGRIYSDRNWSDGIHQAIEAKEDLVISEENDSLRQTTRQQFFGQYRWIGGMTGTADGCEQEFQDIYGMPVRSIETRLPNRRQILSLATFTCQDEKHDAIVAEVCRCRGSHRAVLVGTLTIEESREISAALYRKSLTHQVLNGIQDADEALIIAAAGRNGAVTVATSLAGRGTDIKLDDRVRDAGGLHVIVSQHHRLARVDRQLIGRCARAGDPGTARFFICPSDHLPSRHATWLGDLIKQRATTRPFATLAGEVTQCVGAPPCRLSRHIADVQRVLQKQESRQRQAATTQRRENIRWQMGKDVDADDSPVYRPEATYV